MRPVDFPESNIALVAAPGDEESVGTLRVCETQTVEGVSTRISCFELEDGDLELIQHTGKVWLWVSGTGAHPPVAMSAKNPFHE